MYRRRRLCIFAAMLLRVYPSLGGAISKQSPRLHRILIADSEKIEKVSTLRVCIFQCSVAALLLLSIAM